MKHSIKRWTSLVAVTLLLMAGMAVAEEHKGGHGEGKGKECCESGGKGQHGGSMHSGMGQAKSADEATTHGEGQQTRTRQQKRGGHAESSTAASQPATEAHADSMGGMSCCSGGGGGKGAMKHGAGSGAESQPAMNSGRMRRHGRKSTRGGTGEQHSVAHGGSRRGVMHKAMTLVHNNGTIERTVEEIPGGVRTITTTSDPALLETLRSHPREMMELHEQGGMIRAWDPLFAELAKQHAKIKMTFKDIENGIEAESTSDDPDVTALIRAHAYKVSEFVKRGHAAVHESTPLPENYGKSE